MAGDAWGFCGKDKLLCALPIWAACGKDKLLCALPTGGFLLLSNWFCERTKLPFAPGITGRCMLEKASAEDCCGAFSKVKAEADPYICLRLLSVLSSSDGCILKSVFPAPSKVADMPPAL